MLHPESKNLGNHSGCGRVQVAAASVRPLSAHSVQSGRASSSSESLMILGSVGDAHTETTSLDPHVSCVPEVFAELEDHSERAATHSQHQQSLLSPIQKLPPEILGEILLHCIPGIIIKKTILDAYTRVADVCCHWRQIALDMQELWASFHIDLRTKDGVTVPLKLASSIVRACLDRSGSAPLQFHISASQRAMATDDGKDMLATFLQRSHRWKRVSLKIPADVIAERFCPAKNQVLALQALHLQPTHALNYMGGDYVIDIFEAAPNLSYLSLHGFRRAWTMVKLPWSQITHFRSSKGKLWMQDFFTILNAMPNLNALESIWDRTQRPHVALAGANPVHLPNLKSLAIANTIDFSSRLLDVLSVPGLEEIFLHDFRVFESPVDYVAQAANLFQCLLTSAFNLVERSSCKLKTLIIDNIPIYWVFIILSKFPTISNLTFRNLESIHTFLDVNSHQDIPFHINNLEAFSEASKTRVLPFIISVEFAFSSSGEMPIRDEASGRQQLGIIHRSERGKSFRSGSRYVWSDWSIGNG